MHVHHTHGSSCTHRSKLEGAPVPPQHGDLGQHEGLGNGVPIGRGLLLEHVFEGGNDVGGEGVEVVTVGGLEGALIHVQDYHVIQRHLTHPLQEREGMCMCCW